MNVRPLLRQSPCCRIHEPTIRAQQAAPSLSGSKLPHSRLSDGTFADTQATLRSTAKTMNEAELEKSVKLFGNNTTQRGVYGTILNHLHEHLGQSIAYARINGVAPPWSTGMN